MKSSIFISGLGQISALGQGRDKLLEGLSGKTLPTILTREVLTQDGTREVLTYTAPEVQLPSYIPASVSRRMTRISKMFFASIQEAVSDVWGAEEISPGIFPGTDPRRVGIVIGTAFGCLDSANTYQRRLIQEGPLGASPSIFASSIQNAIASHLSISFGVQGPCATVTSMDQTTLSALRVAYDWLLQGRVDHVIVGIGDELSEYHSYAMAHANYEHGRMPTQLQPQSDFCSAIPGEGCVAFVLSRETGSFIKNNYCKILAIQLYADHFPEAPETLKIYVAACGASGQWSKYKKWVSGSEVLCHSHLYGSLPIGSAFEIAMGALACQRDHKAFACVQMTFHEEVQTALFQMD